MKVLAVVKFQDVVGSITAHPTYRQRSFSSLDKARAFAKRVLVYGFRYKAMYAGHQNEHYIPPSRIVRVSLSWKRR